MGVDSLTLERLWSRNLKKDLKFIKMYEDVEEPMYETEGSAGMDIKAYGYEEWILYPQNSTVINTGLKVKIPKGYELQVRSRSGLAFKFSVVVLNSPGTIDSDYEDEIKICLFNHGVEPYRIKEGDRVAQLIYAPVIQAKGRVKNTKRAGGFGHTGK